MVCVIEARSSLESLFWLAQPSSLEGLEASTRTFVSTKGKGVYYFVSNALGDSNSLTRRRHQHQCTVSTGDENPDHLSLTRNLIGCKLCTHNPSSIKIPEGAKGVVRRGNTFFVGRRFRPIHRLGETKFHKQYFSDLESWPTAPTPPTM